MKKYFVFLVLCLILATGCGNSSEKSKDNGDDTVGFNIENEDLVSYTGGSTDITTPSCVTTIKSGAFSGDMEHAVNAKKITVTKNVKTIESGAFSFTNAEVICIEEGVETIGDFAFMDSYISEIYFPESVKNVGEQIMQTEEGLNGTKIHVIKESDIAKYFEENMPYGDCELVYD